MHTAQLDANASAPRWRHLHHARRRALEILLSMVVSPCPAWAVGPHAPQIGPSSVGPLRIDAPLPRLPRTTIVEEAWQTDEQGEPDRRLVVRIGGVPVRVELHQGRVRSLMVIRPGLRTRRDGIEVGTPVAAIAARTDVRSIIGSGADLILLPVRDCGLVYWTNLELDGDGMQRTWDRAAVAALPKAVVVRAILVTGTCERR